MSFEQEQIDAWAAYSACEVPGILRTEQTLYAGATSHYMIVVLKDEDALVEKIVSRVIEELQK